MSKRSARRNRRLVAHRQQSDKLGSTQSRQKARGGAAQQVPRDVDEPDGPEPASGRRGSGAVLNKRADRGMEEVVRVMATDTGSGPAEEERLVVALPEETDEQLLGEWPYRTVRSDDDITEFGAWLAQLGAEIDKVPTGLSANAHTLALATREKGWLVEMKSLPLDSTGSLRTGFTVLQALLRQALTQERGAPALVSRNLPQLLTTLEVWLGESYDRRGLIRNIRQDLKALQYATGRPVGESLTPLKDALDCVVIGPALATDAPRFYLQVGLPLVRHLASPPPLDLDSTGLLSWTLTYDWLLFKVLAWYTKDPTFRRWLADEENPSISFSEIVELPVKDAIAFLLWMVCGESLELVSHSYPDWAPSVPDTPQLIQATRVDKHIPNFRLGLTSMLEEVTASRRAQTLYGRLSPWGLTPPQLLNFTIMGSVHDILDVAVASIIEMDSKSHWLVPESTTHYNHWLRATIRGYTDGVDAQQWEHQLSIVGKLNNPLGDAFLEPKVNVT